MNFDSSFTESGLFHFPNFKLENVPGTLIVNNGNAELHIVTDSDIFQFYFSDFIPVIHGNCSFDLTLLSSTFKKATSKNSLRNKVTLSIKLIVFDVLLDKIEDLKIIYSKIGLKYLNYFTNSLTYHKAYNYLNKSDKLFQDNTDVTIFKIRDDLILSLANRCFDTATIDGIKTNNDSYFNIDLCNKAVSFEDFFQLHRRIKNILSLICFYDFEVDYLNVTILNHPERTIRLWYHLKEKNTSIKLKKEYIFRSNFNKTKPHLESLFINYLSSNETIFNIFNTVHYYLLKPPTIDDIGDLVANIESLHKQYCIKENNIKYKNINFEIEQKAYRIITDFYKQSEELKYLLNEDFDKILKSIVIPPKQMKKFDLAVRLEETIKLAEEINFPKHISNLHANANRENFIDQAKTIRHSQAHGDALSLDEEIHVFNNFELAKLLKILLDFYFLKYLDFPTETIDWEFRYDYYQI